MKRIIKILSFAILLLLSFSVFNPSSTGYNVYANNDLVSDNGYIISSMHSDILVTLKNEYIITETFEVDYNQLSRGFIRYIPRENTIIKDLGNGKTQKIKYVNDVKVLSILGYKDTQKQTPINFDYLSDKNEDGNKIITMGEKDYFVGKRFYQIKYSFLVGNDRFTGGDEFYYNLNGSFVNTDILNFTFKITMPTSLLSEDLGLNGDASYPIYIYKGKYAESITPTESVLYSLLNNNTIITGHSETKIKAFDAVTIRVPLKEGYYSDVSGYSIFTDIAVLVLIIGATVFLMLFIIKNKNKKSIVSPVEFYPPNDIDPIKMKYVLTGSINAKDFSSLVVYFASKGYLNIINDNDDISLQKVKDIPNDAPDYQQLMFNSIFNTFDKLSKKDKKSLNKDISDSDIKNQDIKERVRIKTLEKDQEFGKNMSSVISLAAIENKGRLNKKSVTKQFVTTLFPISVFAVFTLMYYIRTGILNVIIFFPIMLGLIAFVSVINKYAPIDKGNSFYKKYINLRYILLPILLALICFFIYVSKLESFVDPLYLRYIVTIPLVYLVLFSSPLIYLESDYHDLYGLCEGFKKTITLTEKERLKVLVKDDPSYFYDILPYAYVLDISKVFTKNFEGITLEKPDWYFDSNTNLFNAFIISSMLQRSIGNFTYTSLINAQKTNPSSFKGFGTGGGGFGGGFSGGGFGGGGTGRF